MGGNAINTMMAHQARAGNDAIYFRELVESYTFVTYGKVTSYSDGRVDVACGSLNFTNVEVLVLGVDGWGIKPVPAEGDRVLLIGSQSPIVDIESFEATGTMPPYDESGLKAIPVCDASSASQLITVEKGKIQITGDTKLTINSDGIDLEDKNGNTFVSNNADGVVINGNLQIKRS